MDIKTQTFLILGVSKSGYNAGKYILKNGGKCYLYEENTTTQTTNAIEELKSLGGVFLAEPVDENLLKMIDVVLISPGVAINHQLALKSKQLNKRIISELDFAFLQKMPTIVAITGTNGKTTTVSLIENVLESANRKSMAIGNIGVPVSSKIDEIDSQTICVTEVSSYQLEATNSLCPHIACILNISPDHLERHYNMENYVFLKQKILKNQRESEYAVLNYDDEIVRPMFSQCKAKVVWVSTKERVIGAYQSQDKLYYNDQFIIDVEDLSLKGTHNIYNALFTIAVSKTLGISDEHIVNSLKSFKGVAHRIEFVKEVEGVRYFDDSKSTNTASTISAIKTMPSSTILILGGSEKGEKYDKLFEEIKKSQVSHVILTGASRYAMLSCAEKNGFSEITMTSNFDLAIRIAKLYAKGGDCVLLSPGCASFDSFSNYEERGKFFKGVVESFSE